MIRRYVLAGLVVSVLAAGAFARQGDKPLDAKESVRQSSTYMTEMRGFHSNILRLQRIAQQKKDIVRLNCVNDKLQKVKGHLAVADNAIAALGVATARADEAARQHEGLRMAILYQKVTVLNTEAENCIGEEANFVGNARVDLEIDPSIPNDDPTEPPLPLPDVTRPPEASPFI
jgi:hypothetical protein